MSNTNNLRRVLAIEVANENQIKKVINFMETKYFPKDAENRGLSESVLRVLDMKNKSIVYFQKVHSELFDANQVDIIKDALHGVNLKIIEAIGEIQEIILKGLEFKDEKLRWVSIFDFDNGAEEFCNILEKEYLPEMYSLNYFSSKVRKILDEKQSTVKAIYIVEPKDALTIDRHEIHQHRSEKLKSFSDYLENKIKNGEIHMIDAKGKLQEINLKTRFSPRSQS